MKTEYLNQKIIIVHDKKNYFFRFIKNRFSKDFDVIKHVNICNSNYVNKTKFTFIVFVVYEEEDILTFLNYYTISRKIIVCSENTYILDKYKEIEGVDFLNIGFLKNNLSEILDFKFNLYKIT